MASVRFCSAPAKDTDSISNPGEMFLGHHGQMELLGTASRTRRLDPSVLDSWVLGAPLLDHHGLDLTAARRVRYVLEQSFRYEYDAPVSALRQRLVIVPPPRHGCQYRRAHRLEVTGAKASRRVQRD